MRKRYLVHHVDAQAACATNKVGQVLQQRQKLHIHNSKVGNAGSGSGNNSESRKPIQVAAQGHLTSLYETLSHHLHDRFVFSSCHTYTRTTQTCPMATSGAAYAFAAAATKVASTVASSAFDEGSPAAAAPPDAAADDEADEPGAAASSSKLGGRPNMVSAP